MKRGMIAGRPVVVLWALAGAATSLSARGQETPAPTRPECIALHESGQEFQKEGHLLQARKAFRTCSNDACPPLIRGDCTAWLAETERAIPSVSFEGILGGKDIANVRVSEGDRVLAETTDGTAVDLDPGIHNFQASLANHPLIETTYVLRQGEKNRVVRLDFTPPSVPASFGHETPRQPILPRPIPATVYVFGALVVASAAVGTAFGVLAFNRRSQLTCQPFCADSDLQPVRTLALAADIGFGATVVSAALATYFLVTRPVVLPTQKNEKAGMAPVIWGLGLGSVGARGSF